MRTQHFKTLTLSHSLLLSKRASPDWKFGEEKVVTSDPMLNFKIPIRAAACEYFVSFTSPGRRRCGDAGNLIIVTGWERMAE